MRYYQKQTGSFSAETDDGRVVTIEEYTSYLEQETNSGVVTSEVQRELLTNGATVRKIGKGVYSVGVHGLVARSRNGNGGER